MVDKPRSISATSRFFRRITRPQLLPLLVAALAMSIVAPAPADGVVDSASLDNSIVTLNVYRGRDLARTGSAFVVQADRFNGYVMTSADLVANASTITVRQPSGRGELVANVISDGTTLGIAILKVNGLNASALAFAKGQPATGAVVWSALRWTGSDHGVGLAKGTLSNVWPISGQDGSMLSHSAIVGQGQQAAILLNDCGEVAGLDLAGTSAAGKGRAIGADAIRLLLGSLNIRFKQSTVPCISEIARARQQAEAASQEAKHATQEAIRAQKVVEGLEQKLRDSSEQNQVLVAQMKAAQQRADEAIKRADVAHKNAEDTRLELERKTASIMAQTEAMMDFMEKDKAAAEERFQKALDEQRNAASLREQLMLGVGLLLAVAMVVVFLLSRRRTQAALVEPAPTPAAANAGSGHTEMHKEALVEYVLDGRDEDGIRYLLRISGDQMLGPDGVIIGRNPQDSPYIINHADVSRKHARMKVMKNRVFIEDLGSTNGTSVNGQSIDDKGLVSVANGDQIIIGSVVMKLRVLGH